MHLDLPIATLDTLEALVKQEPRLRPKETLSKMSLQTPGPSLVGRWKGRSPLPVTFRRSETSWPRDKRDLLEKSHSAPGKGNPVSCLELPDAINEPVEQHDPREKVLLGAENIPPPLIPPSFCCQLLLHQFDLQVNSNLPHPTPSSFFLLCPSPLLPPLASSSCSGGSCSGLHPAAPGVVKISNKK